MADFYELAAKTAPILQNAADTVRGALEKIPWPGS